MLVRRNGSLRANAVNFGKRCMKEEAANADEVFILAPEKLQLFES